MADINQNSVADNPEKKTTPIATRLKRRSIEATKEYNNMLERTLSGLDQWAKQSSGEDDGR